MRRVPRLGEEEWKESENGESWRLIPTKRI